MIHRSSICTWTWIEFNANYSLYNTQWASLSHRVYSFSLVRIIMHRGHGLGHATIAFYVVGFSSFSLAFFIHSKTNWNQSTKAVSVVDFLILHHFGILECNSTARRAFNYAVDFKKSVHVKLCSIYVHERTNERKKTFSFDNVHSLGLCSGNDIATSFYLILPLLLSHSLSLQFCMLTLCTKAIYGNIKSVHIVGLKWWTQKFWNERKKNHKK